MPCLHLDGIFNLDILKETEGNCLLQGIEKKTAKLQGSEKTVVARHEAGHAVVGTAVANLIPGQPRVEVKIEIFWCRLTLNLSILLLKILLRCCLS